MVNDKIKALLALAGKKHVELAQYYDVTPQSMNNKMVNNRYSADDLIRIAEFTNCRLGFLLSDGEHIFFDPSVMVNDKIKALLALSGKKHVELAQYYDVTPQSMNNKMVNNRYSADDLIRIAEFTNCRLGFLLSDGEHIFLDPEDARR